MSIIVFTRTVEIEKVAANADEIPVLIDAIEDEDGTYGVKRLDTSAVVVSAGVAMTQIGVGRYSYELSDVTPGVRYRFAYRILVGGEKYLGTYDITATDEPTDDRYLSVSEANVLALTISAASLGRWQTASTVDKERALLQATMEIDAAMRYQGRKVDPEQTLEFPRYPHPGEVWNTDPATGIAIVPKQVKIATLHQANDVLDAGRHERINKQYQGIVYDQTGAMAESFKGGGMEGLSTRLCLAANTYMRRYQLRTGAML